MLTDPEPPATKPGSSTTEDQFVYAKDYYWRRANDGGSWDSSSRYWYEAETGTAKWAAKDTPNSYQSRIFLKPKKSAGLPYASPVGGGTGSSPALIGRIESDGSDAAADADIGFDTLKARFSNEDHTVTDRPIWVHKAGRAHIDNCDFYFTGAGSWSIDVCGGTTMRCQDFCVMDKADCYFRFPADDCADATLIFNDTGKGNTCMFSRLTGGAAGTTQNVSISNLFVQVTGAGQTSGVAGRLNLAFNLAATDPSRVNVTTASAAMLQVAGALKINAGSKLTVDAGRKAVGTYKLVKAGSLSCPGDFASAATVTGLASGTKGTVTKTSTTLNLVISEGTPEVDPEPQDEPGDGESYVDYYWGRASGGGTWTSSTGYWYKDSARKSNMGVSGVSRRL